MKKLTLIFSVITSVYVLEVCADGLPISTETQDVSGAALLLPISSKQQIQISKSGFIQFDQNQHKKISLFYSKVPWKVKVFTPTYNDSIEVSTAYCIWTRPSTVAITIGSKGLTSSTGNTEVDIIFRISPTGEVYIKGKELRMKDIEETIKKKEYQSSADGGQRAITIVIPPKYREQIKDSENQKVTNIVKAFKRYCKSNGLLLYNTW